MQNKRDFGLILNTSSSTLNKPTKQPIKTFVTNTLNPSNDSSDEEEITKTDYKSIINKNINKQQDYNFSKISEEMSKNLKEDPNIYEYDALYDDFDSKKNQKREKSNILNDSIDNSKPKYLNAILAASEKRKIEQSITKEKVEKKRREREQGEYGDKPKFVTKSYEEALALQKKKEIEIEKKEQKNTIKSDYGMMGFYSNLLTKNTAMGARSKEDEERELLKIYQNKKKDYEKMIKKDENEENEDTTRKNKKNISDKNKILDDEDSIKNEIKKLKDDNKYTIDKNSEISDKDRNKNETSSKDNLEEMKLRYLERKRLREEKKE